MIAIHFCKNLIVHQDHLLQLIILQILITLLPFSFSYCNEKMDFDHVTRILKVAHKLCNFLDDANMMCKAVVTNKLVITKKLKGFFMFSCYLNLDNNRGHYQHVFKAKLFNLFYTIGSS